MGEQITIIGAQNKEDSRKYLFEKCDKYDYFVAIMAGTLAGFVDVVFVGSPKAGESILGKYVDESTDKFVQRAAQFFWKNDKRTSGKRKKMPETLEQCISYLEQAFPVSYDARYAKDLVVDEGALSGMRPLNHHLMSLAHSPDPIGLIFSIIDQFTESASFIDKGKLIRVVSQKTSGAIPYLQGSDLPSRLFCGFVNWIGHLLSDISGSSSTRKEGKSGRGAGIPLPFYELFLLCDFKDSDGKSFANTMISVFEQGYDLRFGATMAIPVIMQDLMIRVIWTIRAKFQKKRPWKDCIPNLRHGDLRVMLIVGDATLCVIDGMDAAIRSGGVFVEFVLHLNIVAWFRLVKLVMKEVSIRLGKEAEGMSEVLSRINADLQEYLYQLRQIDIEEFERVALELSEFDQRLQMITTEEELSVLLYEEIELQGITLPFRNHDEFDKFMLDDTQKLIL